jgi:hypothetical protein
MNAGGDLMKVSAAITAGRAIRPGANYTDDMIMAWLSTLDQDLALQAGEGIDTDEITLVSGTSLYDLPAGVAWDSIIGLWVYDERVAKLSGMAYGRQGVSLLDGHLSVYPIPTAEGTLRVAQQTVRTAYTNKTTDDLFLPAPFDAAYRWFIAGQMLLYDRDIDGYNNMILMFNTSIEGFWKRKAISGTSDGLVVTNTW